MSEARRIAGMGWVRTGLLLLAVACGLAWALLPSPPEPRTLDGVVAEVGRRWPAIGHMTPAQLDASIAAGGVVIFDARGRAEHDISHLDGAIAVDPDMSAAAFVSRFGDAVQGKSVVFYCSVGVRSSRLADRVAEALRQRGARAVSNLEGGIFAWHGERRRLVDAAGPTDHIHPYDADWGRLVVRPELIRTGSSTGG